MWLTVRDPLQEEEMDELRAFRDILSTSDDLQSLLLLLPLKIIQLLQCVLLVDNLFTLSTVYLWLFLSTPSSKYQPSGLRKEE